MSRQGPVPDRKGLELTPEICPTYDVKNGPFYVSDITDKKEIVDAPSGHASLAEMPLMTFAEMFKAAADASPDAPAMRAELPCPELNADGTAPPSAPLDQWQTWTWKQYYDDVMIAAKALIALGAVRYDGATIYGLNSPFWVQGMVASIMAGVIPSGIYPTDTNDQIEYKTQYGNSAVAICGDEKHFKTFEAMVNEVPKLKAIVVWNYKPQVSEIARTDGSVVKVLTWDALLELGRQQTDEELTSRVSAQDARECIALVFTSGTTGKPKAVMLSHDNLTFMSRTVVRLIPDFGDGSDGERSLSYLPLSHVAGLVVDIVVPGKERS